MDLEKLNYLSLVAKVCKELENHHSISDKDLAEYIIHCWDCQARKGDHSKLVGKFRSPPVMKFWKLVSVDFVGPFPVTKMEINIFCCLLIIPLDILELLPLLQMMLKLQPMLL